MAYRRTTGLEGPFYKRETSRLKRAPCARDNIDRASTIPGAAAERPFDGQQSQDREPQQGTVPEGLPGSDRIARDGRHLTHERVDVAGKVEHAAVGLVGELFEDLGAGTRVRELVQVGKDLHLYGSPRD